MREPRQTASGRPGSGQKARPRHTRLLPLAHICPASWPFHTSLPAGVARGCPGPSRPYARCSSVRCPPAHPVEVSLELLLPKWASPGCPGPGPPPRVTAHDCHLLDSCCHRQEVWSPCSPLPFLPGSPGLPHPPPVPPDPASRSPPAHGPRLQRQVLQPHRFSRLQASLRK